MKNNIIISGVPRAGKSTIASAVSKIYGYQHISMDSIIAGFERNFPELGINTYADMSSFEILQSVSGRVAPFINTIMDTWEYDEFGRGIVLDVYQLLPEDFINNIDKSLCNIFYFVTADVSVEERFSILKTYDTQKDYTYFRSDNELRESCAYIVEQSKFLREECLKYGLPCFETSKDRNSVIEDFLKTVMPQYVSCNT